MVIPHEDFYVCFDGVKKVILEQISKFAEERFNYLWEGKFSVNFEVKGGLGWWDVVLTRDSVANPAKVFIEYKSSVNEWRKNFTDFLRQIKTRMEDETNREYYTKDYPVYFALVSYDAQFEKYRKVLANEKICLIILETQDDETEKDALITRLGRFD